MNKNAHSSSLMLEIMIAVLIFALSGSVILDLYVTAHQQSQKAERLNEAQFIVQDMADRLYLADDAAGLLSSEGFALTDEAWSREYNGLILAVALSAEDYPAGQLRRAQLAASYSGEELLSLPCDRYFPGEVAP